MLRLLFHILEAVADSPGALRLHWRRALVFALIGAAGGCVWTLLFIPPPSFCLDYGEIRGIALHWFAEPDVLIRCHRLSLPGDPLFIRLPATFSRPGVEPPQAPTLDTQFAPDAPMFGLLLGFMTGIIGRKAIEPVRRRAASSD